MQRQGQRQGRRIVGILIALVCLVASLQLFFHTRIERLQGARWEKSAVRREADFRHEYAIERLQNQLQTYDQWALFLTAFVRSSVNVRADEFRQFVTQSGVFNQDPSLRFVGLAGGVDAALFAGSAKGFTFHSDLNQLGRQPVTFRSPRIH